MDLNRIASICVFFGVLCFLLSPELHSQNCDEEMAAVLSEDLVLVESQNIKISARDIRKYLDREIDGLKQTLLENLSARILLEVKSRTSSTTRETRDTFEDFYYSETEITSEMMLSNGKFVHCLDEEQGRLYGVYTLDPVATANATVKDAELRLIQVNLDVEQALKNERVDDPFQYQSKVDAIRKDLTKAVFLYPEVDLSTINFSLEKFAVNFEKLKQKSDLDSFGDAYVNAQNAIAEKKFSDGIRQLRELNVRYPHRQEVVAYLNVAERRYESYLERTVNRLRARKAYQEALEVFRVYCNTMSCTDEQNETVKAIRQEFFESAYDQFETALKFDNLSDIGKSLSILRKHADIDQGAYRKAEQQFLEYELQKELAAVQGELDQENFRTTIAMGEKLKTSYGYDRAEINRLIEQAETEIYRERVKQERKTRRMRFTIALGASALTNEIPELDLFPEGISRYTVGYSLGLYKKINYYKRYRGHFPRGSDIIGFKVRLFDHLTEDQVPWEEGLDQAGVEAPSRFSLDVMVDGTALYIFHYGGGLVFPQYDRGDNFHYCAELGLRIPMGPFSIQGNIRTDWIESVPVSRFTLDATLEFDFWRKFGKRDRREIERKLGF
jgi:tetratricopeptide (TPR) repeat protein